MKDFRGNSFKIAGIGVQCTADGCTREAVRNTCNAEGDAERTHWHGEVHDFARGAVSYAYCSAHGAEVRANNAVVAGHATQD